MSGQNDQSTHTAYIVLTCIVASLGGFLWGFDISVISGTIQSLEKVYSLQGLSLGLVVASCIFGAIFGILKTALIISVIISVLENFDNKYNFLPKDKIKDSHLYEPLSKLAPTIFEKLDFRQMKSDLEDSIDMDINI